MVRPTTEYAAAVWLCGKHKEKVQRRAARWALNDYMDDSSATSILEHLGWNTLKERRPIARLQTLFKVLYNAWVLSWYPELLSTQTSIILHTLSHQFSHCSVSAELLHKNSQRMESFTYSDYWTR